MDIVVDKDAGRVLVRIRDLPVGVQHSEPTHYLEKHGLILHWDGRGNLIAVEIKSDPARS